MNATEVSTDQGTTVRAFFRRAMAAKKVARAHGRDVLIESLGKVRPGHAVEDAEKVGSDNAVRLMLRALLMGLRQKARSPIELLRGLLDTWAKSVQRELPNLPAEARRDVRATALLALRSIEGASDSDIYDVMETLAYSDAIPAAVNRLFGLAIILLLFTEFALSDDLAQEAARGLWVLASTGEDQQVVEDAFDAAVALECEMETDDPVPYQPHDLVT